MVHGFRAMRVDCRALRVSRNILAELSLLPHVRKGGKRGPKCTSSHGLLGKTIETEKLAFRQFSLNLSPFVV